MIFEEFNLFGGKPHPTAERCGCHCHRAGPGVKVMHVMACCDNGWKRQPWAEAQYDAEQARLKKTAVDHKPAHGGYPG